MPDVGSVCSACFALLQSFQPTAVLVCFIQAFNSAKTCLREQYHPQKAHLYVIINIVPHWGPQTRAATLLGTPVPLLVNANM